MTKEEQKALLATFVDSVRDALLTRAERWPAEWDGHELRELCAEAFDHERSRLLRESRKRRRAFRNTITVEILF